MNLGSNFNFSGIDVAPEGNKFTKPGFQKLTITEVKDATSASGTIGLEVSFVSGDGSTFSQRWWLANSAGQRLDKAMPSFQYLVAKFSGEALSGDINTASIAAKLVGKSREVTVGGNRYTATKIVDGKEVRYDNTSAWLPYSSYDGETQIRYTGEFDKSTESVAAQSKGDDDLPF